MAMAPWLEWLEEEAAAMVGGVGEGRSAVAAAMIVAGAIVCCS
jgi:hypothetical protein